MSEAIKQVWRVALFLGTLVSAVFVAGAGDKVY
jgi:hypothetical protein